MLWIFKTGWEIADRGDERLLVGTTSNLSLSILTYDGAVCEAGVLRGSGFLCVGGLLGYLA